MSTVYKPGFLISGRELQHDFVVLGYAEHALSFDQGRYTAAIKVPPSRGPARAKPLQTTGGWLTR